MSLTGRQQEILRFIEEEVQRSGVMPSSREIQRHFGFSSQTSAIHHLRAIEKKGAIRRLARCARGVVLERRKTQPFFELPLLGAIPAGMAVDAESAVETIAIGPEAVGVRTGDETFALKVRGDSMEGAHILDGDVVILQKRPAHPGDIVAALIDGEVTLKRLSKTEEGVFLRAENPHYPDLIPAHDLRIQGVVVGVIRQV